VLALGPGALASLTAAAAQVIASTGGSINLAESLIWGIYAAAALTPISSLPLMLAGRDRALWLVATICTTAFALPLSFALWLNAIGTSCHSLTGCAFS
jgi:hypothetical protein